MSVNQKLPTSEEGPLVVCLQAVHRPVIDMELRTP
jgi:hypothetical protein